MTAHAKIEPATEIQPGLRVDRLLMLADHLEKPETAEHFYIGGYFAGGGDTAGQFISECGTTACIAGHAIALFHPSYKVYRDTGWCSKAADLLGLSYDQGRNLFLNYPLFTAVTNLQAAATVRHLALTGEIRWNL